MILLVTVTGGRSRCVACKEPFAQRWSVDPIDQHAVYAQHPPNTDGTLFRDKPSDLKTLLRDDDRYVRTIDDPQMRAKCSKLKRCPLQTTIGTGPFRSLPTRIHYHYTLDGQQESPTTGEADRKPSIGGVCVVTFEQLAMRTAIDKIPTIWTVEPRLAMAGASRVFPSCCRTAT